MYIYACKFLYIHKNKRAFGDSDYKKRNRNFIKIDEKIPSPKTLNIRYENRNSEPTENHNYGAALNYLDGKYKVNSENRYLYTCT
jgi:hypothetical protein